MSCAPARLHQSPIRVGPAEHRLSTAAPHVSTTLAIPHESRVLCHTAPQHACPVLRVSRRAAAVPRRRAAAVCGAAGVRWGRAGEPGRGAAAVGGGELVGRVVGARAHCRRRGNGGSACARTCWRMCAACIARGPSHRSTHRCCARARVRRPLRRTRAHHAPPGPPHHLRSSARRFARAGTRRAFGDAAVRSG